MDVVRDGRQVMDGYPSTSTGRLGAFDQKCRQMHIEDDYFGAMVDVVDQACHHDLIRRAEEMKRTGRIDARMPARFS